jgi:protein-disulfide isomerase
MVLFEDLQCPFCAEFERVAGELLSREIAAGAVAVEYRIRSFLGPESVRAANALAGAASEGRFDALRRELFAHQPPEHSGGYSAADLVAAGHRVGITSPGYEAVVREGRYAAWVLRNEDAFRRQDPAGTPAAILDDDLVASDTLYDPQALGSLIRN